MSDEIEDAEIPEPLDEATQQQHFSDSLNALIDKYICEYDMTSSSFIGELVIQAIRMAMSEIEESDDDEPEIEDWQE